jgi:hypothetical protein
MKRTIAALAAVAVAVPSVALAATTTKATLKVSPTSVKHGKRVRVYGTVGTGCLKGSTVTLTSKAFKKTKKDFAGVPTVYTKVGTKGKFSVKTTIPKTRKVGKYKVSGRCGGGHFADATLKVTK